MPYPPQIGEVGLSFFYGGNKINFSTNDKYPFVSVIILLYSKERCILYLNL